MVVSSLKLKEIKQYLPSAVNLLAVSKAQPQSSIRFFADKGQVEFGESRLQEALPKIDNLSDLDFIRWHFIGRIQANKVRRIVKMFDVIHSAHSLALVERISRISREEGRNPKLMLQVKFREDPAKVGFSTNELLNVFSKLLDLPNIHVIGLMTIPPIELELQERKIIFNQCRNFADSLGLKDCSMGMSRDWREAVDAGSTWIRIGSLLFGDRDK